MAQSIIPYDIGCEPCPSAPAETLIQDGWKTYLLFFAVTRGIQDSGHLEDKGVAILDCINAVSAKMGYPNDEGLPEHPLWKAGLYGRETSVYEVSQSAWVGELRSQINASSKRIWGERGASATKEQPLKHFVLPLKEATFECVAEGLSVVKYAESFDVAFRYVLSMIKDP